MAVRNGIQDFSLANPIYSGATLTFYTVSGGVKTATKATLYSATTGTDTLLNPQHLDVDGKFVQPVYVEVPVVVTVSGLTIPDHDTGVIQNILSTPTVVGNALEIVRLDAAGTGLESKTAVQLGLAAIAQIQTQSIISATTGGTATAYTATVTPALAANTARTRLSLTVHTPSGLNPTLAVSGLTALNIKYYADSSGTKLPVTSAQMPVGTFGFLCDGTDWVLENPVCTTRKIIGFTRDMSVASGNVSYTGVGFKPSKVTLRWGVEASVYHGSGTALATQGEYSCVYAAGLTSTDTGTIGIIQYTTSTAVYQYGTLTMTADGFDIAWVKGGSPTEILRVNAICEA